MADFDYSNTILIVKPVGPDAAASLRSKHNANRLMSFHFEDGVSSVSGYDDSRSRECTPYVSRPPELELHLQFDPGPKDATQGFVFGTDEKKCDVQLLENPDPDKKKRYGISKQHFRIDFNWNSGFLRLNNMSPTNGTGMTAPSVNNGFQSLKYNNMHMLHPAEQTKVQVGTLVFEMSFPARGQYQRRYNRNWEVFRAKCGKAVPNLEPLNIQPETEITRFVQRREGRRSAYFLHEEIGTGQFGMVCKASEHRTGELFAAKQFVTRKPGWDAKAYLEIAISQDVVHEHIVSFVDSIDDGGGPVLVMEYMPLGNLSGLEKISLEEVRTIVRQALQALAYLHDEKNITHRDVKPENILVRSRTPELFIKLCDFGVSTQSSLLKTHCGTRLYAAAEIFTGSYTKSVDIWAMGVLGYQFIKGLPAHSEKLNPKNWTKEIRRAIDHTSCQSNDPAVPLLKSMLELNPRDRPSAKACLLHPWMQRALPFSQPGPEQTSVRQRSLETISEQSTEIWDPPTQIEPETPDPTVPGESRKRLRSSESITSRRQPLTRGAKKLQVDKSLEINVRELLAEGTNEHVGKDRGTTSAGRATRTPHVRHDGSTTLKSPGKGLPRVKITAGQTGQKSVQKRARSPFQQALPANEDVPKVTEFDARHVQIKVDGQLVLMRKEDGFLNATQIITLAKKKDSEREYILGRISLYTKVEVLPATKGIPCPHSWINFRYGRILCKYLGQERKLQPLLDYGRGVHDDYDKTVDEVDYLTENVSQFLAITDLAKPVFVRRSDLRVNGSNIIRLAGRSRKEMETVRETLPVDTYETLLGSLKHQGIYVDFDIGIDLCRKYGLAELERRLYSLKPASEGSNDNIPETVAEVTDFDSEHVQMRVEDQIVLLRKTDCFLNATQIITLAKKDRNERRIILDKMKKHTKVDVTKSREGSWVNFQHVRILCKHLGLERQLRPLLEYAQRLQGDHVEMAIPVDQDYLLEAGVDPFIAVPAQPDPVMVRTLDFKVNATHILKAAGQERQMQQQLQKIRRRYHGALGSVNGGSKYKGTYVGFDVAMGLCRKYGLVELESRIRRVCLNGQVLRETLPSEGIDVEVLPSDVAGQIGASFRPDSALPQEWREGQQTESTSPPDNSDPEDDQIQGNDPGEEYPVSDTSASESSISSSEASTERESEHSSVQLGAKTAPLHQHTQYFPREADPPSPPAMISYYKSGDYQPQHSRLTRVELDLKPPSRTASPYESFTNFC